MTEEQIQALIKKHHARADAERARQAAIRANQEGEDLADVGDTNGVFVDADSYIINPILSALGDDVFNQETGEFIDIGIPYEVVVDKNGKVTNLNKNQQRPGDFVFRVGSEYGGNNGGVAPVTSSYVGKDNKTTTILNAAAIASLGFGGVLGGAVLNGLSPVASAALGSGLIQAGGVVASGGDWEDAAKKALIGGVTAWITSGAPLPGGAAGNAIDKTLALLMPGESSAKIMEVMQKVADSGVKTLGAIGAKLDELLPGDFGTTILNMARDTVAAQLPGASPSVIGQVLDYYDVVNDSLDNLSYNKDTGTLIHAERGELPVGDQLPALDDGLLGDGEGDGDGSGKGDGLGPGEEVGQGNNENPQGATEEQVREAMENGTLTQEQWERILREGGYVHPEQEDGLLAPEGEKETVVEEEEEPTGLLPGEEEKIGETERPEYDWVYEVKDGEGTFRNKTTGEVVVDDNYDPDDEHYPYIPGETYSRGTDDPFDTETPPPEEEEEVVVPPLPVIPNPEPPGGGGGDFPWEITIPGLLPKEDEEERDPATMELKQNVWESRYQKPQYEDVEQAPLFDIRPSGWQDPLVTPAGTPTPQMGTNEGWQDPGLTPTEGYSPPSYDTLYEDLLSGRITPEEAEEAIQGPSGGSGGGVEAPGGSVGGPGGSVGGPGGSVGGPGGSVGGPGGSVEAPGGSVEAPGGSVEAPGGSDWTDNFNNFSLNDRQKELVNVHEERFGDRARNMAEVMDIGYPGVVDLPNGDRMYMYYKGDGGFQYMSPATGRSQSIEVDPATMAAGNQRYKEHTEKKIQEDGLGLGGNNNLSEEMGWRTDHEGLGSIVGNDLNLMDRLGIGAPGERALTNPYALTAAKAHNLRTPEQQGTYNQAVDNTIFGNEAYEQQRDSYLAGTGPEPTFRPSMEEAQKQIWDVSAGTGRGTEIDERRTNPSGIDFDRIIGLLEQERGGLI